MTSARGPEDGSCSCTATSGRAGTAGLAEDAEKRRWLPRFAERPRARHGTAAAAAALVTRIAQGEADRLSGLLLGAGDDLGALSAATDRLHADRRRMLRVDP